VTLDYTAAIRRESDRFVEVLARTAPDARVPSCPEWVAGDLVHHLAQVQTFWATIVRDRLQDPSNLDELDRPESYDDLLALMRRATEELERALAEASDEEPVWTWAPDKTVGFVRRRQAHEALIHRLDAELAAGGGARTPLEPELAADGVLEILEVMFGGPSWAQTRQHGPLGVVRCDDVGVVWGARAGTWSGTSRSGTAYTDEPFVQLADVPADPAFTVAGAAGDLDAWLWNRPPVGDVILRGDTGLVEAAVRDGIE
jgi:uncharacterized protein (TIGR03083 family)